ncbi:hypothetical protein HZB60_10295 [candidate division KSB1 bacterium]|nr:hypothetical protein [candidate division KSB1 bacterium]
MGIANLYAGWIGIFGGFLTGLIIGLIFHRDQWLGGYSTWPRRMIRLGHVAFFGLGFINLAYAFTLQAFAIEPASNWSSILFVVGAATMPAVCFLSAWRKPFRHLFAIPVLSLLMAISSFILEDLRG